MAMRYGYFDSEITGVDSEGMPIFDRAETSELFRLLFAKLLTNGVLALPGDCFQVVAGSSGLTVKIRPGFGLINGAFAYDGAEETYTLATAPTQYSRIDRVVLRCNYLERLCEIIVKTGTPAANPVPPELLQPSSGDYYELGLALVNIGTNQGVITQSSITDTRADSSVCGYITQLIDHLDTEVFYDQFDAFFAEFRENSQASFDAWFAGLENVLDENTAGNLLNLINQNKADISALTPRVASYVLPASGWTVCTSYDGATYSAGDLWMQQVEAPEVTENTCLTVLADNALARQMENDGATALWPETAAGSVTFYTRGAAFTADITASCLVQKTQTEEAPAKPETRPGEGEQV